LLFKWVYLFFGPVFVRQKNFYRKWGAYYLFIAELFATQNIGGAKEIVVLL